MVIEFTVDKPQNWLQCIADQIGVQPYKNTLNIPPKIGKGFLKHFYLPNGLVLNYLKLKTHQQIVFSRKAGKDLLFSPIMFFINEKKIEQNIDAKTVEIGLRTSKGIFWPSSHIDCQWRIPVNEWLSHITIIFNKQWLLNNYNSVEDNHVYRLLSSKSPFYIFEEITSQMYRLIIEITDIIEKDFHHSLSNLYLEIKTTELLAEYFEKLIDKPLIQNISNINTSDVNKLFRVKNYILENLSETPRLEKLADMTGFSVSKLHKSFKQVFGKSICTYALHEKLYLAKQMLESQQYRVSEVGYELGYSNLSHFSEAFRKQHGVNPKVFLQSPSKNKN